MATIENVYLMDDMGEAIETSLASFFANNDCSTFESDMIRETLAKGETYEGGGGATPLFWLVPAREVKVGDRFVLTQDVERFPHFIAKAGLTGTVTEIDPVVVGKMDLPLKGAEAWDNSIMFGLTGETVDSLGDFCWHTASNDAN